MIRHRGTVKGDASMHQAEFAGCFLGLKDGDCVKVSQGEHCLFLNYRVSESMGQKTTLLGLQLMRLNSIEDGDCVIELQRPVRVEHLQVKVSTLDWKIVNLNQVKIAQSFLEQISIVWPGASLPIFYDDINFVVLKPLSKVVSRLDLNATVQFIEENCKQEDSKQISQSDSQDLQVEPFEEKLCIASDCDFKEGYLNFIKISKEIFTSLGVKAEKVPWIVQNQLEFIGCPSINELIDLQKKGEGSSSQESSYNKKMVFLEADQTNQILRNQFKCSKLCRAVIGVSDLISIHNSLEYQPKIQILSFEVFLKDPNLVIKAQQIISDQNLYSEVEFESISANFASTLASKIIETLYSEGSFYIMNESYPFCLEKSLYLLTLSTNKQTDQNKNYEIKLMSLQETKKQFYQTELKQSKISFVSRRYPSSLSSTLEGRYAELAKWMSVIKQHQIQQKERHDDQKRIDSMAIMFQQIYQEEIDKILNFIQNSSDHFCLIASFGSNGKSFMHKVLQRQGEMMWKINFRDLSDPNLSFANIELYLHWMFANSPYRQLYLDDLDSLCARIQEGDQHRRKEKVISKLVIRSIARYACIYDRKVIATARSQNSLEQEFKHKVLITLKNPNRQQRVSALRKLHQVYECDDSPIYKVTSQLMPSERVSREKIEEIADNTESLTMAAFSNHAINLTIPEAKGSNTLFNFSKLAGLKAAKSAITNMIEKPIRYASLFKTVPIKLPRGVLLYGATGNGKSALGSSLKDEFKMKYFSVKGSDILSKYIGGSEAAVRDIFQKALSVSPSIIFFDQFESIVPKRSANNTGVNDRIVNQFLCYLDGVSAISGVFIVAASSRPDLIDPAVLRPGRLDSHLFLDYPTTEERQEMIRLFSNSVKIDLDENLILEATKNFSYSDLIGLLKELRIKRSAEVLKKESYTSEQFTSISEDLFWQTISSMKLSVNEMDQVRQSKIYEAFREGKAPDIRHQRQIQQ